MEAWDLTSTLTSTSTLTLTLIEGRLMEAWEHLRFPVTSIRLPEVIGPHADDRHWFYQLWLLTGESIELHTATKGVAFRCVYRDDAVSAIEAAP